MMFDRDDIEQLLYVGHLGLDAERFLGDMAEHEEELAKMKESFAAGADGARGLDRLGAEGVVAPGDAQAGRVPGPLSRDSLREPRAARERGAAREARASLAEDDRGI
nr:hypothetical protein [Coriobacterium glomerans]